MAQFAVVDLEALSGAGMNALLHGAERSADAGASAGRGTLPVAILHRQRARCMTGPSEEAALVVEGVSCSGVALHPCPARWPWTAHANMAVLALISMSL